MRYDLRIAWFLWLVGGLGTLGLHRFYLGKTGTGILWFFTGGGLVVGTIYDAFNMRRLVEDANMRDSYRSSLASGRPFQPGLASPEKPESLEKTILKAAQASGGAVTPGELSLLANCGLEEAKKALDKLASAGHAEIRVRSSGVVVYVFPEFLRDGKDDYIV